MQRVDSGFLLALLQAYGSRIPGMEPLAWALFAYRKGCQMVGRREKWCVTCHSPTEFTSTMSFVIAAEQGKQCVSTRTICSVSWIVSHLQKLFPPPQVSCVKWKFLDTGRHSIPECSFLGGTEGTYCKESKSSFFYSWKKDQYRYLLIICDQRIHIFTKLSSFMVFLCDYGRPDRFCFPL